MARTAMSLEEAREHAAHVSMIPEWVRERAAENMPKYLWIETAYSGRDRWLRCEACGSAWDEHKGRKWPTRLRQGEATGCPRCGETVIPKQMGRGFRHIRDKLKLIWYEKSAADPNAIVAYGAWCERDFEFAAETHPWTLEPDVEVRSFAVFTWGGDGHRFRTFRTVWEDERGLLHEGWRFRRVDRMGPLTFGDMTGPGRLFCDPVPAVLLEDALDDALTGTPFERAWEWEYLLNDRGRDGVEALTLIARYPCIEYMTKLGLTGFLPARLLGKLPPGEVNWRGTSMAAVFRLDRGRLGELKHAGVTLTPELLTLMHWMDEQGLAALPAQAAQNLAVLLERYTTCERLRFVLDDRLGRFPAARRRKALKYMARTAEKIGDTRLNAGDFFDYWSQMERLGEDLGQDANAFPADLHAAEARVQERLRRLRLEQDAAASAKKDEMIAKRLQALTKQYGFSFGGLTLRPARDSAEVRMEGQALHHCVGGYIDNYASGRTGIFVLRRDADPDMPWRTVEIKDGRVIQDRGYHNDVKDFGIPLTDKYRAALDCFWSAWRERNKVIA